MTVTREWVEFKFLDPISDGLQPVGDVLGEFSDLLAGVQTLVRDLLDFYVEIVRPLTTSALGAVLATVEALRDAIVGILNATGYFTYVIPTPAKDYDFTEAMTLLAESVVDIYDAERPVDGSNVEVFSMTFALREPSITNLQTLFARIKDFIKVPEFPRFQYELERFGQKTDEVPLGNGQGSYPDWQKYDNIIDQFPGMKTVLEDTKLILERLIEATGIGFAALDDLTEVILQKAALLETITNKIQAFIEAMLLILNLDFFPVLFVQGTLNDIGLASQFSLAIDEVPEGVSEVKDTATLFSFCFVGPSINFITPIFDI